MSFQGTHELRLDAKNRLSIPAGNRHEFADGVVLFAGYEGCVEVWPAPAWKAFMNETLGGRTRLSGDTRRLSRHFGENSWNITLDSAGRVLLPKELVAHAGLSHEVTLKGAIEIYEIWDRGAAEREEDGHEESARDLAERLAAER